MSYVDMPGEYAPRYISSYLLRPLRTLAEAERDIAAAERRKERFTLVFDGDLRKFPSNPFKVDTPFGRPVAVGLGDAFEELDTMKTEAAGPLRGRMTMAEAWIVGWMAGFICGLALAVWCSKP